MAGSPTGGNVLHVHQPSGEQISVKLLSRGALSCEHTPSRAVHELHDGVDDAGVAQDAGVAETFGGHQLGPWPALNKHV